jgi:trk system potassium uptake protein
VIPAAGAGGRRPSVGRRGAPDRDRGPDLFVAPVSRRVPTVAGWVAARALAACAGALVLASAVAVGDGARALAPLAACGVVCGGLAWLLWSRCTVPAALRTASVHAAVCVAWLVMCGAGTAVYLATDTFSSIGDAAFESVAGFTTTALSVLDPVEGTPAGVLLWRAATQWIGGFGALLVVVAILPLLGVGGIEVTERDPGGTTRRPLSVPRFEGAVRRLGSAYLVLSGIGVVLFLVAGLGPLDAVSYAMTTISTGGFGNHDGSFAYFASPTVEWFAVGGMALAGMNLAMVLAVLRGDRGPLVRSVELRAYAALLLGATALVAVRTAPAGGIDAEAVRHAAFAVTSAVSTTGHASVGWTGWDHGTQVLLLVLIGVGAMSGSAGGGFRITRALTLLGSARRELTRTLHPRSVVVVKVGRTPVDEALVSHLVGYQITFLALGAAGSIALAAAGLDLTSAISGAISALATCGPALGSLDPLGSAADQPGAVRAALVPLMLVGRLEIAPVLVGVVAIAAAPGRAVRRRRHGRPWSEQR